MSFVGHLETARYRFEHLEAIDVPTVILHGSDDPLVPVAPSANIAGRVPDADLRIIDGWGYDLPVELAPGTRERHPRRGDAGLVHH